MKRVSLPVKVVESEYYREIGIRSHGKGIFHKEPVTGKSLGDKRVFWVQKDTFIVNIVFAWEQAVAKTTKSEVGLIASHRFPMYEPLENQSYLDYMVYFFLTKRGKSLLELASPGGAGRNKTLGQKEFENLKVVLPSYSEQQKIADFLSTLNTKIQQLTKKKRLLEQYKRGVLRQIFNQQIYFLNDNGEKYPEWDKISFGEVFERITRKNKENNKNVLTISAQHGLISQTEFFNRSVAAQDVTGYYLLEKGEFAYNKSYSNDYPMGAIKMLKVYEKGVVSTLYICFKLKDNNSGMFYEQYFESGLINADLQKIAQEGARNHGLLNISVVEFFRDVYLIKPSLSEQEKIAGFLLSIDAKIKAVAKQIETIKAYKNSILQQLFV